jgi:hypothetical protein
MTPLRLDKNWVSSLKLAAGVVSTENSSTTIPLPKIWFRRKD